MARDEREMGSEVAWTVWQPKAGVGLLGVLLPYVATGGRVLMGWVGVFAPYGFSIGTARKATTDGGRDLMSLFTTSTTSYSRHYWWCYLLMYKD